ncbi:PspA/IM30 family protein [Salinibacter ruber]|uniref:PspA/IM30 family protein n=1 Tax=Salinibacter ruber TaxID=146919 RepID=UPI00216740FB|nr:PspA/IM30 family protein [Salinibacter ruber]MCS4041321.1 phage shock protein A [Salinibacter ruber]
MSIWSRFKRAVKSLFGGAVSAMEDPRTILEQNIRELNDQVPEMNENIATVKANKIMLEKEVKKTRDRVEQLSNRIKTALKSDREDIAKKYAKRLEDQKESLERTKEQLKGAERAYEKALKVKKAFMREKEQKIQEAKDALRQHERAQWQAEIADTMEQFEVSGLDQTHDEMVRRLDEESAKNEARMEMALDSVDTEALQIEEDAEELRAQQVVDEFKADMGMVDEEESLDSESVEEETIDLPEDEEIEEPSKTIGKQRNKSE